MSNPFESLDRRLTNIEALLLSIKHPEPLNPPHPARPEEFTITELADYLKCTKATIHTYKKRGIFPYYQTGRTVFLKKTEVDKSQSVGNRNKKGASN